MIHRLRLIVSFEYCILQYESPHIVTESVGVQMTLEMRLGLDLRLQGVLHRLIKLHQHLDSQKRGDSAVGHHLLQSICKAGSYGGLAVELIAGHCFFPLLLPPLSRYRQEARGGSRLRSNEAYIDGGDFVSPHIDDAQ
jgi:hypothetical protein